MKFKEKHEGDGPEVFIFECSGRALSVFMSVVGINDKGDTYTGFDDELYFDNAGAGGVTDTALTRDERKELAFLMVSRWLDYGRAE